MLAFFPSSSIIIVDEYNIINMQSRFVRVKCRLNRELSAGRKEMPKAFGILLAVHRSHPAAI